MSNWYEDLANGKYKVKNDNSKITNNETKKVNDNWYEDLANGKYKIKTLSEPTNKVVANIPAQALVKTAKEMKNAYEEHKIEEGKKLLEPAQDLMNRQQQRLMKGANNLADYAKKLEPNKIEEIKATSAILHPELLKKQSPDAKYYLGRYAQGTEEALEDIADATVALGANLSMGKNKVFENVTSLGGKLPNKVSERFKQSTEELKEIKEKAYNTDLLQAKELSEILGNKYEPNKAQEVAGDVLAGVGGMLPTIATNLAAPGAGYATLALQGSGGGTRKAYNDTGDLGAKEEIYGLLSGLTEIAIEKLSGGIGGLGKGAVDEIAKKIIKNGFLRNATGEGIEEAVTTLIDPYLQRLTYDKGAEGAKASEVLRSALIGSLTSMLLQGGSATINLPQNIQQNKQNREDIRNSLAGLEKMLPNYESQAQNQLKGTENLIPQKNVASESATTPSQQGIQQTNQTEGKTAQNGNIEQIARNDAKLEESVRNLAKDLNVEAEFVEIDDVSIEGYEQNGKIYINRKAEKPYNRIFKHELTHYLEQNGVSHAELSKEIMNSNAFANQLEDLGMNLDEYRQKIINRYAEKGIKLTEEDANREIISKFVEEKMFNDEKSVRRLAEENPGLMQKIKNWIDDMIVKFKGTAEEKELLRMQKMYKQALSQINNANQVTDAQYSIGGVKAKENINDSELTNAYNEARATNQNTKGWFKDKEGKWKFEFSDKDMTLKENIKLADTGNKLGDILEHDLLFRAYPELRDTVVNFKYFKSGSGFFDKRDGEITLNKKLFNTKDWKTKVEASLLHEIQHAIQEIEGHSGAANPFWSKKAYYETLGEIEAADTKERFLKEKDGTLNRNETKPRTSEANPKHPKYDDYMQTRGIIDKAKDAIFPYYAGEGKKGYEISEEDNLENNKADLRKNDNRGLRRYVNDTAGKEPAFSLPETDNQGRKLSAEQQEFFKDSKVRDDEGRLKPVYHGTKRADRVGYYFDPAKATSGPMAFFTDDVEIATNYSKSKQDTSISREADTEYDLFKVNGKDLDSYWDSLSPKQKRDIAEKGNNIGFDEDWENVVYGENASEESFGDQYKWRLNREYNGNAIKALYGIWIEDGNLMFEDMAKFKDILNMAGIENVEYLDKFKEEPKVYEVYMNLKNPFVTSDINQEIINKLQKASENATIGEQYTADSWDKSNIEPKDWMSMLRDDIKNNTTHSWTIIPDWVTDVLKSEGYDGIQDTGGKYSGLQHNVYIPFYSNQIKNVDNTNPTENADIRYSIDEKEDNTSNARALSRYAQTLQKKHKDIPEHVNLIQKEIDNGNFMHEVIRDKRSLNYAENYIKDNGFEDAVKHWDELMKRGKAVDKDELALGQTIYNLAVENKDTRLVMKMASDLVQEYTEIGRNLQSATLLRKMTPDGRLYALERSVQKINQDLMQKFDDFENIEIPEKLADELLNSETQKQMDDAVERIQQYIADQIPATWQEKLNSWRYLAMLGNPRTHIRNIIGNSVFIPAVDVKNAIAQVGEKFIPQEQRTKSKLGKKDVDLLKYAENDFDRNKETIRGENKYDIKSGIQEKRTIYSTKALEAARKGNFDLLEAEDAFFLKYRYKKAFAQALKAKGITLEQIKNPTPEITRKVNETRIYAINEAQKATYRDASSVAAMINRAKRKMLNQANQSTGAKKLGYNAAYLGLEGLLPFTKTPVNIVKRGLEYSPAGLVSGIYDAAVQVKKGNKTASQAIDEIASGVTGTAIVGLGYLLASLGLVSGGDEEKDKEQALKELQGYQNYALNVFGKSYTIDWSAPSSIPLFIGVELYRALTDEDESNVLQSLMNIAQPVVEMSMLQGINDALTTLGEDSAIGNVASEMLLNYLGQYNPTLFGQIARTIDPVRRTTYVNKNIKIPAKVQRFIQQQVAKIPGASKLLPSYKDQFGQEQITDNLITRVFQNFLSPGYIKDIKEGPVEKGLAELYEKTGETKIIPSYASKTLTVDGEKINLTAKEYDTYAKTRGNVSMKGLEGLLGDKNYKNLSDEQKTKVIEGIYDYANDVAKSNVLKGFELEGNSKKAQELENKGMDFYKFIMIKKTADTDGNGYVSDSELNKAISKYDATKWKGLIKKKDK